ncbi:MAG: type II toxin-antitoxin system RelE/ParE family toxin [Candidatus Bipolaricaulis sp.]|nr:type II toxin-antitoxin system RelE/ParE family toxin [Candidatus Bipolaricaulis sp.]
MTYTPQAFPKFNRTAKKLPKALRAEIDRQVDVICRDPLVGEAKIGDLAGVRVHKFRLAGQVHLLAYLVNDVEKTVTILALGGHENFYRDLKRYLAG